MDTTPNKGLRASIVVGALIIAIAAIVVAVILVTRGNGSLEPAAAGTVTTQDADVQAEVPGQGEEQAGAAATESEGASEADLTVLETREAGDPLAVGAVDAPVGMVVYSDYQCGYCARWDAETLPELLPYVEAGDLRIEWVHTLFFGAGSEAAARAAYAAGLQGKYLEYNAALFPGGQILGEDALTTENLVSMAGQLGLDQERFAADLESPATAEAVSADAANAQSLGVTSTPTFVLAGTPIQGAQPTEVFVESIDNALTSAR